MKGFKNFRWTEDAERELAALHARQELTVAKIAAIMGLRIKQVSKRAKKLGLSKAPTGKKITKNSSPNERRAYQRALYAAKPRSSQKARESRERADPEKVNAAKLKWQRANKEKTKLYSRKWLVSHRETHRVIVRRRRALLRAASGSHTVEDVQQLHIVQKNQCAHSWCRKPLKDKYHVDHIISLARGGSNDRRNLQILCQHCNLSKWAKHPIDFARQHGMLL